MHKKRYNDWLESSQGLVYVDMLLLNDVQGLGMLDVELIEEFPKLKINSKLKGDSSKKYRHVLLSKLWVMGAYELIRLINDINKKGNSIGGDAKKKLKEVLTIFTEIRTPLAKLQKSGKEKRLYSQVATMFVLHPKKGVGWHIYDGKIGTVVFRKDLGDNFLELLKIINEDIRTKYYAARK